MLLISVNLAIVALAYLFNTKNDEELADVIFSIYKSNRFYDTDLVDFS